MAIQQLTSIEAILGADAATLLQHQCRTIPKESLHLPGPDYVERIYGGSDRPTRVLTSLQALIGSGRLGYVFRKTLLGVCRVGRLRSSCHAAKLAIPQNIPAAQKRSSRH